MANAVIMPKAGITVESCIIGAWEKKVGDSVKMGDVLFTYETDKASFECESTAEGTLLDIFFEEGDEVPCLVNVCAIGNPGEDCSALRGGSAAPEAQAAPAPATALAAQAAVCANTNAKAVIMPKAGITVESCIIGEWLKNVGDQVDIGDILFTYETDKASFECESTEAGELLAIFFEAGEEVPCLENVCAVGPHGEPTDCLKPGAAAAQETPVAAAAPVAVEEAVAQTAVAGAPVSPRAAKLAKGAGVDASMAVGTGPNGRILERDVQALIAKGVPAKAAYTAAPETEYEDVKFSGIRRAISKSMHTSLSTMAQLTHTTSFDATAILNYRKALKAAGGEYASITLGDIILYAVSRTLLNHPDLNANMLDDNSIRRFNHVNLGVAVDTPRGLMVPTIVHADQMSLLEISRQSRIWQHSAAKAISALICSPAAALPFPTSAIWALRASPRSSTPRRPAFSAFAARRTVCARQQTALSSCTRLWACA